MLTVVTKQDKSNPDAQNYALVALDGKSGQVRWQKPMDLQSRILTFDNDMLYMLGKRVNGTQTGTGKGGQRTINTYAYLLTAIHISDGAQVWQKSLTAMPAALRLTNGTLYGAVTQKSDPRKAAGTLNVTAWHIQDGGVVWQKSYDISETPNLYGGSTNVLIEAQGVLYTSSGGSTIMALKRWQHALENTSNWCY